ncbi:MAG: lipopolysaccharide biosynthesis protein [Myxococcota bacterium]
MGRFDRWLPPGSFRARVIGNAGYVLGGDMMILGTGMVFTILAARVLGPAAYGLLQLSLTVVRFIDEFMDVRVEESVLRYVAGDLVRKDFPRAQAIVILGYLTDILLTAVSVTAIFLVAPWVARVFFHLEAGQEETATLLMRLYAGILILKMMNGTSKTLLRVHERFRLLGFYRSMKGVGDLLFAGIGLFWGVTGVVCGFLASAAMTTILVQVFAWPLLRRLGPWRPAPLWPEVRRIGAFVFQTNLSGYLKSLNRHADMLILGYFAPPEAAGYYRIAMSFSNLLGLFAAPLGYVVFPAMSRMHAMGDPAQLRRLIRRITGAMAVYSLPAGALMALFAGPILAFTVKADFLPALPACYALLGAFVVANLTIWTRPASLAIGRPGVSTLGNGLQAAVMLVAAIILVPRMQATGSAWAYFLGTLFANLLVVWMIQRALPLLGHAGAGPPPQAAEAEESRDGP